MNVYIGGTKDYSAMRGPCASGYHIPLQSEIQSLINAGISLGAWVSNNGDGVRVYLKMPYAGCRNRYASAVADQGSIGYYATSSANISDSNTSYCYVIRSEQNEYAALYRSLGLTIRPFKDTAVVPDNSWTVLKQGTGNAGIYHNSTLGLISLSSDGSDWITISDKNLGATTVYSDGATLSEANCGKYYQRGNNYGFPFTGSVTTSSNQVNAGLYGPGNYYSSSTFIIRTGTPIAWDSSGNNNLRGGVTGIVSPAELKNAYIGEYTGFEYSYDFRNKTISTLQNDGWTFSSGTSGLNFDSNGMYYNGTWYNTKPSHTCPISPVNINKITISETVIFASDTENTIHYISSGTIPASWYSSPLPSADSYAVFGTSYNTGKVMSSGTKTKTIVLDLVNKKVTFSCPELSYTSEKTITDSNISTFRALSNTGITLGIAKSGAYIQSCYMKVE